MKYNKREIMKTAWFEVREHGVSMSVALKGAWAIAKAEIEAQEMVNDYDFRGCKGEIEIRGWEKYGKCRTYISVVYWRKGRVYRTEGVRCVDTYTGEYVA